VELCAVDWQATRADATPHPPTPAPAAAADAAGAGDAGGGADGGDGQACSQLTGELSALRGELGQRDSVIDEMTRRLDHTSSEHQQQLTTLRTQQLQVHNIGFPLAHGKRVVPSYYYYYYIIIMQCSV